MLTSTAETRRDLHAWLGRHSPTDLYNDSTQKRVDGTCDWILDRPLFTKWLLPDEEGQVCTRWVRKDHIMCQGCRTPLIIAGDTCRVLFPIFKLRRP